MRVVLVDQILENLGLDKTSENYQKIYKIGDQIIADASDGDIYEESINRGLATVPVCKICGKTKERYYTSNGVLDSEECPNMSFSSHKESFFVKIKRKIKGEL